ncbi:hypothetical protein AB0N17_17855 [Streptomyces sp. NPDC051133]|uniref:hypothetical protein n=1 Tax=Streptomyces sp. NPDC051133 TaxID=3155521 RepID=UPI003415D6B0
MTVNGPGPWWRGRRSRIRSQWPTRLPGIRFCARGTLTYQAPADLKVGCSAVARATARLALDDLGRDITSDHLPEELDAAQEQLTMAVARWRTVDDAPGLWLKARINLMLGEQDTARAQGYQDALRVVTLQLAQEHERRDLFRRMVLDRPDATRIWWLERHLDDLGTLDWNVFNEKVLPLVDMADDTQATTERIARALLYVWQKLGDDPGQHARFVTTARAVLDQMGWEDAPWAESDEAVGAAPPDSRHDGGKPARVAEMGADR